MSPYQLSGGLFLTAIFLAALFAGLYVIGETIEHFTPDADQKYGCTVAQQAPNGECK